VLCAYGARSAPNFAQGDPAEVGGGSCDPRSEDPDLGHPIDRGELRVADRGLCDPTLKLLAAREVLEWGTPSIVVSVVRKEQPQILRSPRRDQDDNAERGLCDPTLKLLAAHEVLEWGTPSLVVSVVRKEQPQILLPPRRDQDDNAERGGVRSHPKTPRCA
jgi:hypothetical protein